MKYNLTVLTKRFGNLFFSLSSLISLILTFETLIEIVHHINSDYVYTCILSSLMAHMFDLRLLVLKTTTDLIWRVSLILRS